MPDKFQVQGRSTGVPVIPQVNVGALTSASTAASTAANAAEDVVHQQQAAARQALPSIITVQVLGFGDQTVNGDAPPPAPPSTSSVSLVSPVRAQAGYDDRNLVQVLGHGTQLDPAVLSMLTADERRRVQQSQ
jgi:filamentous hemagglutinin